MSDPLIIVAGILLVGIVAVVFIALLSGKRVTKELYPKNDKEKKAAEKVKKAQAELKRIKEMAKVPDDVKKPDAILANPPAQPEKALATLEQFPVPRTIQIELTRIKDGTLKRATTKTGKVTIIPRSGKSIFFFFVGEMGYFVDPAKIITVQTATGRRKKTITTTQKLVYDVFHAEPLDASGNLAWSWDVEHLLRDSAMAQYIAVATFEGGFQLTPALMRIMVVVGLFGAFIGLAVNGSAHLVPTTIINWVP